jgi:ribonucleotide monophosphatase NagD (HAD superfamily)
VTTASSAAARWSSGKPHRPIYEAAIWRRRAKCSAARSSAARCAGDRRRHVSPTCKGAAEQNGIDVLYVSGGIHARDYGEAHRRPILTCSAAFLDKQRLFKPVADHSEACR